MFIGYRQGPQHQDDSRILDIGGAVECRIVSRLNRFVVLIEVKGQSWRACTNNTGKLLQFLVPGRTGFCLPARKPGKTDCSLFAVEDGPLAAVIDTRLQMRAFEIGVQKGLFPWLKDYTIVRRDAPLLGSRIDYLLESNGELAYLEVKSAVLRDGRFAMYPDCPTARGRRHVAELAAPIRAGGKAYIVFIAALPGITAFRPDRAADPELALLLAEARSAGVQMRAVSMAYDHRDSAIHLLAPDLQIQVD